jgi:hypothetical protein
MKTLWLVVSSSRVLWNSLLVLSFALTAPGAGQVSSQDKKIVRETESGVELRTYQEIPEATGPCAPEACDWWNRLRQAGNDLQKKSDKKAKTNFFLLLYEGQQKAYRIPLTDKPPQMLVAGKPTYNMDRKNVITGTVVLSVEFRADASVGEVRLIKGLGTRIDEEVIRTARQSVFLPAIKNGAFVTHWENVETKFSRH